MMVDSIASASMSMSQVQTQQAVSVSLMKDAMDSQSQQVDQLIQNLDAAMSGLGEIIDTMA